MSANDKILEILQKSYEVEINGFTFYTMTAEKSQNPATKELFQKLAHDEVEHQNYLKGIAKQYQKEGVSAFNVKKKEHSMGEFASKIFTQKFVEQAKGATFEMGALSVGMTLETNAISLFTEAQKGADSKEVKDFYAFLASWEKEHFDSLKNFYDQLRVDFWGEGSFAPF
jgi:rubrerythrin